MGIIAQTAAAVAIADDDAAAVADAVDPIRPNGDKLAGW